KSASGRSRFADARPYRKQHSVAAVRPLARSAITGEAHTDRLWRPVWVGGPPGYKGRSAGTLAAFGRETQTRTSVPPCGCTSWWRPCTCSCIRSLTLRACCCSNAGMAKGFFTQGVAVLFEKAPSRAALREALEPAFEIAREDDGGDGWAQGADGLIVTYRPDVNGYVNVDVVHRPWPDHMGDPTKEPELFGAWTFGHFGPFAFPGNLERAAEQNLTWEHAGKDVKKHTAFVRVRLSYIFGAGGDAPV